MRRKWVLVLIPCLIVCGSGGYFLIRAWLGKHAGPEIPSWQARAWERLGNLNRSIESNAHDWRLRMYRADVYRDLALRPEGGNDEKWMAKAMRELDDAIADFPLEGRLYAARASYHEDFRDYEKAIEDCTTAIDLGYRTSWVYSNRAWYRQQAREDLNKALEDIEAAITLSPGRTYLYQRKAWLVKVTTGQTPDWSPEDEAIKDAWREFTRGLWRPLFAVQSEEPERAREYWRELRRLTSDVSDAYESRGREHLDEGRYVLAVHDFCLSILLYNRNGDAWEQVGNIFKKLGIKRLALGCYFMATRSLHSPGLYVSLADILMDYRRFSDAASYYTGALEHEWDSCTRARIYLSRGKCLRALGQRRAALVDFRLAIKAASAAVKPSEGRGSADLGGHWLRGLAYYELGEREKALADLEKSDFRDRRFRERNASASYTYGRDEEKFLDELRRKLR